MNGGADAPGKVSIMDKEQRIYKDENGFYNVQIRFLPVEDWEPNDGWRTIFISSIYEYAEAKLK